MVLISFQLILKKEAERKKEQKKKLKELLDHIEKVEQAKRNAAIYQQKQAELVVYQKQYGKVGVVNGYENNVITC